MSKKLAIKGHPTRGKEVIEILKMMGGRDVGVLKGNHDYYVIDECENNLIKFYGHNYISCHEFVVFTLEEFLEKYPYKVGDKIPDVWGDSLTIKSMSWSADCKTMVYDFEETEDVLATEDLLKYNAEFLVNKEKGEENGKMLCDITLRHLHRNHLKNVLSELYEHIKTTSKEELEQEFKEIESEGWTNVVPTVEEFMDFCNKVNKKPEYPKTYKECRAILDNYNICSISGYKAQLLVNLQKLLACRDAYWKIAGKEMGLDKPWEPDWNDEIQKYCIRTDRNKIVNCSSSFNNRILAFPTEEMRDAFFENFKDLIEECKEFL